MSRKPLSRQCLILSLGLLLATGAIPAAGDWAAADQWDEFDVRGVGPTGQDGPDKIGRDAPRALDVEGPLTQVAENTRRLTPVTIEQGFLRLDSRAWLYLDALADDEPEQARGALAGPGPQQQANGNDGSAFASAATRNFMRIPADSSRRIRSSRPERNEWSAGNLTALLITRSTDIVMSLEETAGPGRRLELRMIGAPRREPGEAGGAEGDAYSFSVSISSPRGQLLRLSQAGDGSVRWLDVRDGQLEIRRADSLAAFMLDHHEAIDSELRPLLHAIGIALPPQVYGEAVQEALLTTLEADGHAEALALREQLDAMLLNDEDGGEEADEEPMDSDDADAASREVMQQSRSLLKRRDAFAVVRELDLASNREYLAGWLEHIEDDTPLYGAIRSRLEDLSEDEEDL